MGDLTRSYTRRSRLLLDDPPARGAYRPAPGTPRGPAAARARDGRSRRSHRPRARVPDGRPRRPSHARAAPRDGARVAPAAAPRENAADPP